MISRIGVQCRQRHTQKQATTRQNANLVSSEPPLCRESWAPTLQAFFTQRLMAQRHASAHTVAAYRDTFRLLLGFVEEQAGKRPAALDIEDLDAPRILAFLDHLERSRGNTMRTRNARLAAIHSLFRFAALRHPEHAELIERVLAIPPKRFERKIVSFLSDDEVEALLAAPDRSTFLGRRDHALLVTAIQTGLRVTELIGLRVHDVVLGTGAHVRCLGLSRTQDKPSYAERWLMPSYPASCVDCLAGGADRDC